MAGLLAVDIKKPPGKGGGRFCSGVRTGRDRPAEFVGNIAASSEERLRGQSTAYGVTAAVCAWLLFSHWPTGGRHGPGDDLAAIAAVDGYRLGHLWDAPFGADVDGCAAHGEQLALPDRERPGVGGPLAGGEEDCPAACAVPALITPADDRCLVSSHHPVHGLRGCVGGFHGPEVAAAAVPLEVPVWSLVIW